jgi:hypothetical protein
VIKKNISIVKPHLIICEGADATYFIISILAHVTNEDSRFEEYQALDFGGISDLHLYLENLQKLSGYKEVKTITVIRDAEKDARSALASIKGAFSKAGFACAEGVNKVSTKGTPRTGYTLFPSCGEALENGTLEDLCLRTLSKDNSKDVLLKSDTAVKDFCFKRPHKNRLHAYFSLTDEYVGMKLGEAAKALAFDFNCPEIKSLRQFLSQMLSYC